MTKTSRSKLPNGARAIMASRLKAKNDLDAFWTPPWGTRALVEVVLIEHLGLYGFRHDSAWEPACGEGHMAEVLRDYFGDVFATDVHNYGYKYQRLTFDFLLDETNSFDWIITNPPFGKKTLPFVLRALDLARHGVAMFLPLRWIEGIERYQKLFHERPPTLFAPFAERVPLCKGRWDPDGGTATAYCWLVWVKGREPLPTFLIPPGQRRILTHSDDRERFAAWTFELAPAAVEIWRTPYWTEKDAFKAIAKKFDLSPGTARNLVRFGLRMERESSLPHQEAAE